MTTLALVLVQVMFASLAVVGRLVLPVVPAGVLVTFRILGAATALLAFNAMRGGPWLSDRRVLGRIALAGLLGVTANQSLFLFGLRHTTAVNATILVTTVPVFTVLGSLLAGLERPSPLKLTGIVLAAAGALVLVDPARLTLGRGEALGNLLILLGMTCYAAYFLVSKPIVTRYDPVTVSAYVMLFAAIGVLPIGVPSLWRADLSGVPSTTWWLVIYVVVFPTIFTYFLNLWALRRVSSGTVATFIYLQPLFAALTSPWVLGEAVGARTILAGAIIFTGLGLVILAERLRQESIPMEALPGE
ncbi:MAG: DMT family transporter [Gemmatimonadales bacterium]